MLTSILANLIGGVAFLFIFWKKLREDYPSYQVFTTAFYIIAGASLGFILSLKSFPPWWFWAGFIGILAGLGLGVLRFKFRFFESFEASIFGLLPWLSLIFLADSIKSSSVASFLAFVLAVGLIGLYYYFDKHYKNFSWYRSGRIGFSGLTVAGAFFLLRALFAIAFPFVISFVNKYEVVLSGVSAFILFLLTFNLARQKT